jgi:hypothetical protein
MNDTTIKLVYAAPLLGVSVETLLDWIRAGCPCVNLGPGKGRGYRISVAAARAWRDARPPAKRPHYGRG